MFKYKGFHPHTSDTSVELYYYYIDYYNKKPTPGDTIRVGGCGYYEYSESGWKVIDESLDVARIPGTLF